MLQKSLQYLKQFHRWNIEKLKKLVLNGPNNYPGANYIIRPDGVKIRLEYVTDSNCYC